MENKRALTINFFGGSYGNFVHTFLTGNLKKESINLNENNFHNTNQESSVIDITKGHYDEKMSDELNLKITYKMEHIDLIVRNVYKKTKNLLEKKTKELFVNYTIDIDNNKNNKEIITIAFYKNSLLHGLTQWNKILKKSTIELPFDYFFTKDKKEWFDCWKNIFVQLKVEVIDEYITDAFDIFKNTQQQLITEHNFYKNAKWTEQDVIGKGNILGEIYYYKHSKDTVPIDVVKYKDTRHMLSCWIDGLDNNIYV